MLKSPFDLSEKVPNQGSSPESANQASWQQLLIKLMHELLSGSDSKDILNKAAALLVPDFGDLCLVNLLDATGQQYRFAEVHAFPPDIGAAFAEIRRRFPLNPSAPFGLGAVIRTGRSELIQDLTESMLKQVNDHPDYVNLWMSLGLVSWVAAPIRVRGQIYGGLAVNSRTAGRLYQPADLAFVEDIAGLVGMALERALLLQEVSQTNRNKTAFLAHVSHEIRTPLTIIRGYAELFAQEKNPDAMNQKKWVDNILRSSQQLEGLIDDVLDISRVELGKFKVNLQETSLTAFTSEIQSLLHMQAKAKQLEFVFTQEESLPEIIRTDALRLKQILFNIIGNAIKFTESGHIHVHVSFNRGSQSHEDHRLIFAISDTGIGISHEEAQKLFQPFSQGDSSMNRKYGGAGIGLYLSKRLAELLGGDLILSQSTPNAGSTFILSIDPGPVAEALPSQVQGFKAKPQRPQIKEQVLAGINILLAEDSPELQALLELVLTDKGAKVQVVKNGQEAVYWAQIKSFDIILMDLQMPILDGYEAQKCLREAGLQVPVLALTAHAIASEYERCMAAGFSEHLCKPLNMQKLVELIQDYSQKTKSDT